MHRGVNRVIPHIADVGEMSSLEKINLVNGYWVSGPASAN